MLASLAGTGGSASEALSVSAGFFSASLLSPLSFLASAPAPASLPALLPWTFSLRACSLSSLAFWAASSAMERMGRVTFSTMPGSFLGSSFFAAEEDSAFGRGGAGGAAGAVADLVAAAAFLIGFGGSLGLL